LIIIRTWTDNSSYITVVYGSLYHTAHSAKLWDVKPEGPDSRHTVLTYLPGSYISTKSKEWRQWV